MEMGSSSFCQDLNRNVHKNNRSNLNSLGSICKAESAASKIPCIYMSKGQSEIPKGVSSWEEKEIQNWFIVK